MLHSMILVAGLQQKPGPDGEWAEYEPTGYAAIVCPCGLSTGFIEKADAAEQYREHAQENAPTGSVRIHPETGPASAVLNGMLGEITRD